MILVNPFEKDPDETYRAYQRFRKRNEYDKAYRCIENLLKRFPDDMELLDEIVAWPWARFETRILRDRG